MIEFGSDFHYIAPGSSTDKTIHDFYPSANYYADGRQALIDLYRALGWERLWVPAYYCYDVLESLKMAGLNLGLYADYPGFYNDSETLEALNRKRRFHSRDAILRVDYFGMRSYRGNNGFPVPVVEDHTHDLFGGWARNSKADWCIASLRKTLPVPEGGILWSPVGLQLPEPTKYYVANEEVAKRRWDAMKLKARYLSGDNVDKSAFFDTAPVCSLDFQSINYLHVFDIYDWYRRKRENWNQLSDIKTDRVRVLMPEDQGCYPFSLVLLFDSFSDREKVRGSLIENYVFPSVLWSIPSILFGELHEFSRRMLSIHCDARYSTVDIQQMKSIIESVL